jgi:hypothetical protein
VRLAIIAGVILGVAYTLSPLTVLALAGLAWAAVAAGNGLSDDERRWYWSIVWISILVRLTAIALLFLTADPSRPFASFFGDEELYKFRTMWLRNIGQGLPMSPADVIYSYDDVGHTSYIYVLALVQAIAGDAPYGLHVMNMVLYLCGVLGLYRLARASYGGVVAMAGFIALLTLPSLVLWSISVLKEPVNVLMITVELVAAVMLVRAPRWHQRLLAVVVVVAFGAAMESLRTGGLLTAAFGTIVGLMFTFVLSRGRRFFIAVFAVPVAIALLITLSPVQDRVMARVRQAASYHAGHVVTPGYSYRLLEPRYYADFRAKTRRLTPPEAVRYSAKALWAYFAQPLPRETWSRSMLAYLPEHVTWWVIALFLPLGFYAGLKRDVLVTAMLAAHAMAAIAIVALSSGNIGTLIRHRSLAMPYVIWLAAVGAHECVLRVASARAITDQRSQVHGDR